MAFVAAGLGLATDASWWPMFTLGTVLFSLALSVTEWPRAHVGVYLDIAILIGLAVVARS